MAAARLRQSGAQWRLGKEGARRNAKIFLQLVGSFFEAVAVPTRLAELIGGARQLPTSYPGEIVLLDIRLPLRKQSWDSVKLARGRPRPIRHHPHSFAARSVVRSLWACQSTSSVSTSSEESTSGSETARTARREHEWRGEHSTRQRLAQGRRQHRRAQGWWRARARVRRRWRRVGEALERRQWQ